jgi:hypothetical protein
VANSEEHLMEAPYLVTDTNRKGYGVACSCGFRSPLFETREEAQAAATDHLEAGAEAAEAPKGFLAKRRAKKQQRPEWEERRRG